MEKITLPQVRDLGQTIGDPFLFFRSNFKLLFRAYLFYAVLPLAVAVAFSLFGTKISDPYYAGQGMDAIFRRMGSGIIITYIIYMAVSLTQQFYIAEFMLLKENNNEVTNSDVLNKLKNDWRIITTTLLVMVGLGFAIGLFGFSIFASAKLLGNYLAGFLMFLFIVLLIYAFVPLSNIFFIRLREKLGIADSLTKAFKITSGNWLRTFVAWFVIFIIFYLFSFFLIMIFTVFAFIFNFHKVSSGAESLSSPVFIRSIVGIGSTLSSVFVYLMANIMNVFIGINYFSLSEKYDGYHLKAEINQIGVRDEREVRRQEGEY